MKVEPIWVVAGTLAGPNGGWLMHCRPLEKPHGGLWEFPGGKIEGFELPIESLIRELNEELGIVIDPAHCAPIGFAEDQRKQGAPPIVILFYKVTDWVGEPQALEGGRIGWFTPQEIANLSKPPLDEQLTAQLFENQK